MPWSPREPTTSDQRELIAQLTATQLDLRQQITLHLPPNPITTIAGCDSAFVGDEIFSVVVVFDRASLQEIDVVTARSQVSLPYIPGFLAFREVPNLLKAFGKLSTLPDLVMVDGHGIMHPRRMGIATHLGIKLGIPTIGIAKKKLVGTYEQPGPLVGDTSVVTHKDETIGVALRSKLGVKPIFVSPGNRCDHTTAVTLTVETLRGYKLPEPTRTADTYSKRMKST